MSDPSTNNGPLLWLAAAACGTCDLALLRAADAGSLAAAWGLSSALAAQGALLALGAARHGGPLPATGVLLAAHASGWLTAGLPGEAWRTLFFCALATTAYGMARGVMILQPDCLGMAPQRVRQISIAALLGWTGVAALALAPIPRLSAEQHSALPALAALVLLSALPALLAALALLRTPWRTVPAFSLLALATLLAWGADRLPAPLPVSPLAVFALALLLLPIIRLSRVREASAAAPALT